MRRLKAVFQENEHLYVLARLMPERAEAGTDLVALGHQLRLVQEAIENFPSVPLLFERADLGGSKPYNQPRARAIVEGVAWYLANHEPPKATCGFEKTVDGLQPTSRAAHLATATLDAIRMSIPPEELRTILRDVASRNFENMCIWDLFKPL
jgi:hypothetical protein